MTGRRFCSVVAGNALVLLVTLLRLDRHGCDRASFEASETDRLTAHFAETIFTGLDSTKRRVDLRDELPLPVAGAKMDPPIRLARSPVGKIRLLDRAVGEFRHRFPGFAEDLVLPAQQLLAEISQLLRVHELFVGTQSILADRR